MVESVFGAIKRKFGASVSSLSAHTMRAEVYCRAIAHNIISFLAELFQRSPSIYKYKMIQEAVTIDNYIESMKPILERDPEPYLVDRYLGDFYHRVEDGSIDIGSPEGQRLCCGVINHLEEKGYDKKAEEFCYVIAAVTRPRTNIFMHYTAVTLSIIVLTMGFAWGLINPVIEDIENYFVNKEKNRVKRTIGIDEALLQQN